MDETRTVIEGHEDDFEDFQYYLDILDKIEENLSDMPDISIEACKALFEGVSKTILSRFGITYSKSGRSADTPSKLLKKALKELNKRSELEGDFINTTCNIVNRISKIRNERGDISHGKAVPKEKESSPRLARVVAGLTDSSVAYFLRIFFSLKISKNADAVYEENEEFNDFLDEEYDLEGVKYSQALFDQDPILYEQNLTEYNQEDE